MLLSLLFSVWLAVGAPMAGGRSFTSELQRAASPRAVVLQAASAKQAQQPRLPDPAPALPGSPAPIVAARLSYPAPVQALESAAPRASAAASPYQARAPPAR